MSAPYPPPCIHTNGTGLCAACQAGFEYDPQAYFEFGDHPQGLANWQAVQEEIAAEAARPVTPYQPDPDIPF